MLLTLSDQLHLIKDAAAWRELPVSGSRSRGHEHRILRTAVNKHAAGSVSESICIGL